MASLPQTTSEQRSRFFTDVEALLSPGFLTHPVSVGGVRLQMRSLGRGDLFMLRARTTGASGWQWRVWAVATSIWMIDGRSVLGHDDAVPFLAGFVEKLPKPVLDTLFSLLLGMWIRVGDASDAAQIYCYETHSRYKWLSMGSQQMSGVPGADTLTPSVVRRIWVAFNDLEDSRRGDETAWEGFKLVASSNAPKAIQKLDKIDTRRRTEETQKRQSDLDLFYYQQIGVIDPKGEVISTDGSMHRQGGSKTVEVLENEMRRWVTGDQDLHDAVVANYKAHISAEHEAQKQRQREYRMRLEAKRAEMGRSGQEFQSQPLVALTAEQLQATLQVRNQGRRPGVAFLPDAPKADRVTAKYMGPADTGELQVVDGKVVDPTANPATDQRTLDHLIKGRNPAFNQGG